MTGKKRGLGRGLDALLRVEEGEARSLPVSRLRPNQWQPRTRLEEADLEELVQSVRLQGVVQPIVVTPGPDGIYTIVAGERRWRAAQKAGLAAVPVVVREVSDERELLELALVENLQRSDLNPLEEAEAYRTLQQTFHLSQEEIALRVGKARATVTNALRLLKLPPEVQALVREGRLTAGQARPLLALGDSKAQIELAEQVVRRGYSAREVERRVASREKTPRRTVQAAAEAHAAAAAEKLTRRLQTRVEILRRGKGGVVRIYFHSEEELIRLYELLMRQGTKP